MFALWRLKVQEQTGSRCRGTGDKTGKATIFLMVKHCPLRLLLVMVKPLSPTTLLLLAGPSDKPSPAVNSVKSCVRSSVYVV